ncbi:hypothetical protein N7474_003072 [Penicillium riverlandense]|uniref:uncharacterized protein n=1 Tax=Penicillium riverlandense TaxID=1903569 RepID=UPI002548F6AB|nr:uncharacterized protein N7474_003072 [Penicillium riverlandense]KAJ5825934.1 hypothetical protein N7474_003072 [Penicillium riverlandense]
MQSSMRLLSREALTSKSLYVCSTCRQEVSPRGLAPVTRPLQGPLRWRGANCKSVAREGEQTATAPASQTDLQEGETKLEVPEEVEEKDLLPSDEYEQADTWQGLKRLGYLEKNAWRQQNPTEADEVQPYV